MTDVNREGSGKLPHLLPFVDGQLGYDPEDGKVYQGRSGQTPVVLGGGVVTTDPFVPEGNIEMAAGTQVVTAPSTTDLAGLTLPAGDSPDAPVDGDFWYDGTNFKGRADGNTVTFLETVSTDPLVVDGNIEMQDGKNLWLNADKTAGFSWDPDNLGGVWFHVPAFYGNFATEGAMTLYAYTDAEGASADALGIGDGIILLQPNSGGAGGGIVAMNANGLTISNLPTSTDPAATGALFTCTSGEVAALLGAGAKYVLLSKGAP